MDIQIAKLERMGSTGSVLLKSLQNNTTPILDLLVRESIQNSLDAAVAESNGKVKVTFTVGDFVPRDLNSFLEGSEPLLNKRFPHPQQKFLAVADKGTEGLTGKLSTSELHDDESYGNLLKLVYEIGQSQEKKGSGGSWGLGKTIYFRIGIGLVVFYSRIQLSSGRYESRLAITLVEDETKKNISVIPYQGNGKRRGIAWWGKASENGETIPITDENEIRRFLDVFEISPYEKNETGTTVIIPYIDEKSLLENNRIEYRDSSGYQVKIWWYGAIADYLRIAVQRWYAPRIDNEFYQHGAILLPVIRSKTDGSEYTDFYITKNNLERCFKLIQYLYNSAVLFRTQSPAKNELNRLLAQYSIEPSIKNITLQKEFAQTGNKSAGTLVFARVNENYFQMTAPQYNCSPYIFYELRMEDENLGHRPVLCYCRQPGMIVEYTDSGRWVDRIPSTSADEYLIAIFVLNSEQILKLEQNHSEHATLEEYARSLEEADHLYWADGTFEGKRWTIIEKIQNNIARYITSTFEKPRTESAGKAEQKLSRILGKSLLPADGFGTFPNRNVKKTKTGGSSGGFISFEKNDMRIKVDPNIEFTSDGFAAGIDLIIGHRPADKKLEVSLRVNSDSGPISSQKWSREIGLEFPFSITKISKTRLEQTMSSKSSSVQADNQDLDKKIKVDLKASDGKNCSDFYIDALGQHDLTVHLKVYVSVNDRSLQPVFSAHEVKDA